jgi:hypothetical protein
MKLARESAASQGWDLDVIFVRDPMATRFGIMPCDDFSYRIYGRRRVLKGRAAVLRIAQVKRAAAGEGTLVQRIR